MHPSPLTQWQVILIVMLFVVLTGNKFLVKFTIIAVQGESMSSV